MEKSMKDKLMEAVHSRIVDVQYHRNLYHEIEVAKEKFEALKGQRSDMDGTGVVLGRYKYDFAALYAMDHEMEREEEAIKECELMLVAAMRQYIQAAEKSE